MREQLVFEDSLVGAHHIVNSQGIPEQACHTALALTPERMLLLGSQGAHHPISSTCYSLVAWLVNVPNSAVAVSCTGSVSVLCARRTSPWYLQVLCLPLCARSHFASWTCY